MENSREVAVAVFLGIQGQVFLQKRASKSRLGEKLGFFGGGIEDGETPDEAIKRELKEELDYAPNSLKYWGTHEYVVDHPGKYNGWKIILHAYISPLTSELFSSPILEGDGFEVIHIQAAIDSPDLESGDTGLLQKIQEDLKL